MNKTSEYSLKREKILTDSVWRVLLLISLPMAFSNFIQVLYSSVDTYFAGKLGIEAIAGITFSLYIINFIRSMGMGICIAGTTIIAKNIGAGSTERAKASIVQLFYILFFISILLILLVLPFSRNILYTLGATEEIILASDSYFRLNILSLVFLFLSQAYLAIKKAMGGVRAILTSNFISLFIKIASCYIFIDIMGYGIGGLVLSTVIARFFICIMAFWDLALRKSELSIGRKDLSLVGAGILTILIIGLPLGLEKSAISIGNVILNRLSISFGYEFIAARGIVNKMINLGQSLLTGFAVGVAPIISQNIGAGNYKRVREIIYKASLMSIIMSASMYSFLRANGSKLALFFLREDSGMVHDFIMEGFYIFGFAMIGWSLYQVGMSVFKGFGHTQNNMSVSFVRLFIVRIPLVYFLVLNTSLAQKSIWVGMLASNGIGIIVLWWVIYLKYYKEERMKVYFIEEEVSLEGKK